ncbi:MAG: hypothetical protein M3534_08710 [Actinomycetota bacterium]|nr:hypothetical protein [Actinomycetota bacterium]
MAAFVRISAVLVGMANVFLYSPAGDGELGNAFILNLDPWWPQNFLYALSAIVAGLLVSSIFLRFARRELRQSFFARYGVMVLAICLGGAVLSGFLAIAGTSFDSPLTVSERLLEALSRLPFTVVAGSVLGAAEGGILAFPLAAILGRFRIAG